MPKGVPNAQDHDKHLPEGLFVETSLFFALGSPGDPDHERVREVFEETQ